MQRSRSVGHTVMQLSHILLFQGKIHVLLLLLLLQDLLKDFFFLYLYSTFYNTIFIGLYKPRLKSEYLSMLQQKSASHHFSSFLWYIPLHDHTSMSQSFLHFLFFFFWRKGTVAVNNVFIVQKQGKIRHGGVIDIIWNQLQSVRLFNCPD